MSFICIVCRDIISATQQQGPNNAPNDIVVTKCGHLHHLNCLTEWFNSAEFPRQECPYCKSIVRTNEFQRVFPAGDEETDDLFKRFQDSRAQDKANQELQKEVAETNEHLVEIQSKFEDECLFHDILRYEYSKLYSRAENISNSILKQREIGEESQIIIEQLRAELDKKEKENAEIQKKLAAATARGDKLASDLTIAHNEIKTFRKQNGTTSSLSSKTKIKVENSFSEPSVNGESQADDIQSKLDVFEMCMKLIQKEKNQLLQLDGSGGGGAAGTSAINVPNKINSDNTRNKKIEIIDIDVDGPEVTIKIDPELLEMLDVIKLENNCDGGDEDNSFDQGVFAIVAGTNTENKENEKDDDDEEFHSTSSSVSVSGKGNNANNKPSSSRSEAGSSSPATYSSSNSILNHSNESLAEIPELPGPSVENSVIIVDS